MKDRKFFGLQYKRSSWRNSLCQKRRVWEVCVAMSTLLLQEDISRLRRKLETTKKPDNVPKCDEILMEEIKDYKVRSANCLCLLGLEVVH